MAKARDQKECRVCGTKNLIDFSISEANYCKRCRAYVNRLNRAEKHRVNLRERFPDAPEHFIDKVIKDVVVKESTGISRPFIDALFAVAQMNDYPENCMVSVETECGMVDLVVEDLLYKISHAPLWQDVFHVVVLASCVQYTKHSVSYNSTPVAVLYGAYDELESVRNAFVASCEKINLQYMEVEL